MRDPRGGARFRGSASAALLLAASLAFAGGASDAPRRVGPAVREVRRDDLVVEVLGNGTCLAVRRAPTPGVVAIQFWVGAGSVTEGALANHGVSHFVEHMIFEGTTRERGRGFDLVVRSAGGTHNGYTSLEKSVYHVTVPSAGFRKVLEGLVELVREAALPEERFKRERKVILQELREGEDDIRRLSSRLLSRAIYRVHPYRHPVGGEIEEFRKLTLGGLEEYYGRLYVPGNEMLVIAGDVDVKGALEAARKLLGKEEAKPLPGIARPAEPEQTAPRYAEERHARAQKARVTFAWRTVDLLHSDLHALDVLAMVLGRGRASRLYRSLKEERGLVLSVGAYSWTPRDQGYFGVWAQCEDGRVGEVRAAVAREVERVRAHRVDPDELDRARAQVEAANVFRRQTAEGVAHDLASDLFHTGDPDFSEKYLAGIRAVTADEIMQVARTYLVDSRLTVAAFRPERGPSEEEREEGGGEPAAAERARARQKRSAPEVREMPGGWRLVLVPDRSLPVVSVSATLLAGLRLEPYGKAGVSALLAAIIPKGTRRRSGEELAEAVEGRGGSFGVLSGRNSLSVRVTMLADDLEAALDVAAELLAEPRLDAGDLERVREETLAAIRARSERGWSVAGEILAAALYRGHPYELPESGTEETVAAITQRDLVVFHRGIARRGNLVLAVAGDFDADEAAALAEGAFRRLPGGVFREGTPAPASPPPGRTRVEKVLPKTRSALVLWGFAGVRMGTAEADALDVAAEVLSGMSGRLWTAARGEEGLAYAVGAFNASQLDPGHFGLYVATRPELEGKALEIMRKELARLVAEPPTDAEMRNARATLAGDDLIGLQARGAVALRCALYERYGLGAAAGLDRSGKLAAVTAADVVAVARKYLDPEGGVLAVVKPGESE